MNSNSATKSSIRPAAASPKQLVPPQRLPSQEQLINMLTTITTNIAGRSTLSEVPPLLPPTLPKHYQNTEFADMYTVGLINEDLDHTKPIRQQPMARVLLAMQIKNYRALGVPPPVQYRTLALTFKLDKRAPSLPKGRLITVTPALEPIKVIVCHKDNRSLITDNGANTGIPIIPEFSHANKCKCQAVFANNNYESIQALKMCMPGEMSVSYKENSKYPKCYAMGYAAPAYKNISDVFVSEISSAGTVLPRMIRRAPVAQMTRSYPVVKKPQYANIDIQGEKTLAAAIAAQLHRADVQQFTVMFNEQPVEPMDHHLTRFPTIHNLMENNIDISSYGEEIKSMEDILINEPLVDAFYGFQTCEYCDTSIIASDELTFLSHLLENHMALLASHFTCPACLFPSVYDKKTYNIHYTTMHASTTTLMYVLNETNVHVRMQHAHILNMFIYMCNVLNIQPTNDEGPKHYVSAIGGFEQDDPVALAKEITNIQVNMLPESCMFRDNTRPRRSPSPAQARRRSPSPPWVRVQKKTYDRRSPVQDRYSPVPDRRSPVHDRQSPCRDSHSSTQDKDSYAQQVKKAVTISSDFFQQQPSPKMANASKSYEPTGARREHIPDNYHIRAHGSEYTTATIHRHREENSSERETSPQIQQRPPLYTSHEFPQLQRSKTEPSITKKEAEKSFLN